MAGLILFSVIGAWLVLCTAITLRLNNTFLLRSRRPVWSLITFGLLTTFPLWDQFIGYVQYYEQCRKNSTTYLHPNWESYKSLSYSSESFEIKGLAIPIIGVKVRYVDEQSHTIVLEYRRLYAQEGLLFSYIGLNARPERCQPPEAESAYEKIHAQVKPQKIEIKRYIY